MVIHSGKHLTCDLSFNCHNFPLKWYLLWYPFSKMEKQRLGEVQLKKKKIKFAHPARVRGRTWTSVSLTTGPLVFPNRCQHSMPPALQDVQVWGKEETTEAFCIPWHTKESLTSLPPKKILIKISHSLFSSFFTQIIFSDLKIEGLS